jgi:hypothetical protein
MTATRARSKAENWLSTGYAIWLHRRLSRRLTRWLHQRIHTGLRSRVVVGCTDGCDNGSLDGSAEGWQVAQNWTNSRIAWTEPRLTATRAASNAAIRRIRGAH